MNKCDYKDIFVEDVFNIVSNKDVDWNKFREKTIAVTGATGLIGKIAVISLINANRIYNLKLSVMAFVRNMEKAKEIFAEYDGCELSLISQDVTQSVPSDITADYLIHGASITTSKTMVEKPVETIITTVEGTRNMLEFASRCNIQGMVYLSSMEVYGILQEKANRVVEADLGYINPLEVRSSYSEGKRMAECLCAAYASEYNVNVKIARLAQTFGAGIDKSENRVFAQFARSILNERDIVLHTNGEKANCYCYTTDVVTAILVLLTRGEKGQAYNVANDSTFCSVKEMAEIFILLSKNENSKLVFDIPKDVSKFGYAPSSIMRLCSEKLMNLNWKPKIDMNEMINRLLMYMEYYEME